MKSNPKRHFITLVLTIFMVCIFVSCNGQKLDETVQQAYELRMNGQADSAKELLEQAISDNSNNAAAWFELARTKQHIGLGNPRELVSVMEEVQQFAQNAVENEPGNVIYQYYNANVDFFMLYMAMRNEDFSAEFIKASDSYKSVLEIKPDYHEAKLALIELYAMIPPEMGGDPSIAEKYVQELETADVVYGAKAREIIMPENADYTGFWKKIAENQINNADVYEALGKTYLYKENIEEATKVFEKAISLNSEKNILYVDLGRYYLMQAMQNPKSLDSLAPQIQKEFEVYLKSQPEPIIPLKAYVIGQLAMIKQRTGDKEGGNKLIDEAKALDPNYSKAFGIPSQILLDPPDKISRVHTFFFRPF